MPTFGLHCTEIRMVAWLCPDPIGELAALDLGEGVKQEKRKGKGGQGQRQRMGYDPLDNSPMLARLHITKLELTLDGEPTRV